MIVRVSILSTLCAALVACGGSSGGEPTKPPASDSPVATSITVSPSTVTSATLGVTSTLVAEVRDQKGALMSGTVSWTSSNASVATVSSSGIVTTMGDGSADVTASYGSLSASARVTVTRAPASIVVTPGTVTMTSIGASQPLQAVARDQGGAPLSGVTFNWTSSDPSIAAVSSNGMVTAIANGAAIIRATSGSVSGTAAIAVNGTPTTPVACSTDPVFTHDLVATDMIKVITQIGVIGGANTSIVGRAYVMAKDGIEGVRIPLTAPTALKVAGAKHYVPQGAPQGYTPDWSLLIDLGCGITMELYHVKDVAASIKAVADTTIYSSSAWQQLPQPVSFAAGDTFGWYVRGLNSVAFDVIAHDNRRQNTFANQQRYVTGRSNLLDIVCPWNFFTPSKKAAYMALIGAQTGVVFPGAGCGSVERDVAGTPAGQWFQSQQVTSTFPFAKTGNYGDPLPIVLGIDQWVYIGHMGPSDDMRIDRNNPTWKDPATITTSWCYSTGSLAATPGYLWLEMVSAMEMKVAYGSSATCPSTFPSSGYVTYYR